MGSPGRVSQSHPSNLSLIMCYVVAPLDDFQERIEDLHLAVIMEERIKTGGPYITMEELEKRLEQQNNERKRKAK